MYKSNIYRQTEEILNYPSNKGYNLLSPPYNPKLKSKPYINQNMNVNISRFQPINLYSSCFSPFQNGKNLSVKNIYSPDDKTSQNLINKFTSNQKGTNSKIIGSPNTTNSDLPTTVSITSQQSNESFKSNNNNISINTTVFMPNSFQTKEFNLGHRYNYSMINPNVNFYNNIKSSNNNIYINGNYNICINNNYNYNYGYYKSKSGSLFQNQNCINNRIDQKNQKYKINNKLEINNYRSNNSSKSISNKSNTSDSCKISSSNSNNSNKLKKAKRNDNNYKGKKHFNKFNSSKENSTNENTVILSLKIKIAKNDYRIFNLKKYDDLFISLEKFFDLNKIKQSLVKPIVNKIFQTLNKIFWLFNNKIGKYDEKYLDSLKKVWEKNNGKIPKRNKSKDNKDNNNNNSTISSSDSNNETGKHNKMLSNSYQESNTISEDDKDEKQKTAKSF